MSFTPEERENVRTYVKAKLRAVFPALIRNHFPEVEGLPADDETLLADAVDYITDEELESGSHLEGDAFLDWAHTLMQGCVIDAWFRQDAIDVLINHVSDTLADHPEISEEQIRAAVLYFVERAGTRDRLDRFGDAPEKWLKLIDLAERDTGAG